MELTVERFDLDDAVRLPNTDRPTPSGAVIPTDFYFVVDEQTEQIIEPIAIFLLQKFNGPNSYKGGIWAKAASAEAAANDLKNWWSFINAHPGVEDWTQVSDLVLNQYIRSLVKMPSNKTGGFLDPASIRRYCASIESFHAFAGGRWPQYSFPSMKRARALLGSAGGAPSHAADEQPRPLSPKNMRKLNAHIGPKPSEASQSESSRTRLAWMIAHQTGLRVDEIVNLKATTFADLDISRRAEMSVVTLTVSKTKGLKAREVFFPVWLVGEIKIYIAGERESSRRKGAPLLGADEPQNLLLNRPDAPAGNAGKRATAATIEADFARAIKDADLMRAEERLAGAKDATLVEVAMHTFHDGRHTYAHGVFGGLLKQGMATDAAWLLLRNRLGHKHTRTTIDPYLRSFSEIPGNTSDRLADHLAKIEDRHIP